MDIHVTVKTGLEKPLAAIAKAITNVGAKMSELTDSVDQALEAFLANEADEDARLVLAQQTIAALQEQIDALEAGAVVNEENVAALVRVRDALQAQLPTTEEPPTEEPPVEEPAQPDGNSL